MPLTTQLNTAAVCGTGTSVAFGGGTNAWSAPSNITALDSTYATNSLASNLVTSQYLVATNYGFSIPATAVIIGFIANIFRKCINGLVHDVAASITLNAGTSWVASHAVAATVWPTSAAGTTYGAANGLDLWNTTVSITPTVCNSPTFGWGIQVGTAAADMASVDVMSLHVFYAFWFDNDPQPVILQQTRRGSIMAQSQAEPDWSLASAAPTLIPVLFTENQPGTRSNAREPGRFPSSDICPQLIADSGTLQAMMEVQDPPPGPGRNIKSRLPFFDLYTFPITAAPTVLPYTLDQSPVHRDRDNWQVPAGTVGRDMLDMMDVNVFMCVLENRQLPLREGAGRRLNWDYQNFPIPTVDNQIIGYDALAVRPALPRRNQAGQQSDVIRFWWDPIPEFVSVDTPLARPRWRRVADDHSAATYQSELIVSQYQTLIALVTPLARPTVRQTTGAQNMSAHLQDASIFALASDVQRLPVRVAYRSALPVDAPLSFLVDVAPWSDLIQDQQSRRTGRNQQGLQGNAPLPEPFQIAVNLADPGIVLPRRVFQDWDYQNFPIPTVDNQIIGYDSLAARPALSRRNQVGQQSDVIRFWWDPISELVTVDTPLARPIGRRVADDQGAATYQSELIVSQYQTLIAPATPLARPTVRQTTGAQNMSAHLQDASIFALASDVQRLPVRVAYRSALPVDAPLSFLVDVAPWSDLIQDQQSRRTGRNQQGLQGNAPLPEPFQIAVNLADPGIVLPRRVFQDRTSRDMLQQVYFDLNQFAAFQTGQEGVRILGRPRSGVDAVQPLTVVLDVQPWQAMLNQSAEESRTEPRRPGESFAWCPSIPIPDGLVVVVMLSPAHGALPFGRARRVATEVLPEPNLTAPELWEGALTQLPGGPVRRAMRQGLDTLPPLNALLDVPTWVLQGTLAAPPRARMGRDAGAAGQFTATLDLMPWRSVLDAAPMRPGANQRPRLPEDARSLVSPIPDDLLIFGTWRTDTVMVRQPIARRVPLDPTPPILSVDVPNWLQNTLALRPQKIYRQTPVINDDAPTTNLEAQLGGDLAFSQVHQTPQVSGFFPRRRSPGAGDLPLQSQFVPIPESMVPVVIMVRPQPIRWTAGEATDSTALPIGWIYSSVVVAGRFVVIAQDLYQAGASAGDAVEN